MGKNAKIQRAKIFGKRADPQGPKKELHMSHFKSVTFRLFRIKSRVTSGKINKAGKHILKPDWTKGVLEHEPNPEAAVHELAHLFLAPEGQGLAKIQRDMDAQFGFVISQYGYMKQKRSLFEIMPMAMEQKIRRRFGLPPSLKYTKSVRTCLETGELAGPVVNGRQLIRSARNLDVGALRRLAEIDLGILKFCAKSGWVESNDVNARINRRALKMGCKV
jgi:hypothetical protein